MSTLAPATQDLAAHPVSLDNPIVVPSHIISAAPEPLNPTALETLDSAAPETLGPAAPIAPSLHPMTTRSKTGSLRPNSFPDFQLYSATKHPPPIALHSMLTEVEPTCFTNVATDTRLSP